MNVNIENNKNNLNSLKSLYEKIQGVFSNIKIEKNMSLDDLIELYSNDNNFFNELKIINESIDEIAVILSSTTNLNYEYYYCLSIRRMILYLLNNVKLFITHLSFIDNLLINFFNLIHKKLLDDADYKKQKILFLNFFENQKEYFYTKIYESSEEYEETIIEINNILWR